MGGETPKKVVVSWTAVKNAGSRATRASAKLERRVSPLVTSGQLPLQRISRSSGHRSPDAADARLR